MDDNKKPRYTEDEKKNNAQKTQGKKYTKGFYVAFALCLCAVGAAAWYTYGDVSSYMQPDTTIPTEIATKARDKEAEAKMQGVTQPQTQPFTDAPTQIATEPPTIEAGTEASTQAMQTAANDTLQVFYPATKDVLKGYTDDTPVYSETLKDWRTHKGVDFAAKEGDTVKAIDSGTVTEIKKDDMYGDCVVIEHNSGFVAMYAGVTPNDSLKAGDHLSGGDSIGIVSTVPCEVKDKPHIHVEITKDGKTINPLDIVGEEDKD